MCIHSIIILFLLTIITKALTLTMLPDVLGGNLLNSFNFIVSVLLIEQDKRSGRVVIECTMMFGFHAVLLRDAVSQVS